MPDISFTLVSHPLCPFVQRAAIVLFEKGVSFERVDVDLAAKPDWFLALSPTDKVPLLIVRQPGEPDAVLFESVVICEYLEESLGGAGLYSSNALARARQRSWIEFGTATLADAWQFLNAKDRPTADAKQAAFRERLQRLEEALGEAPYFNGADFRGPSSCLGVAGGARRTREHQVSGGGRLRPAVSTAPPSASSASRGMTA